MRPQALSPTTLPPQTTSCTPTPFGNGASRAQHRTTLIISRHTLHMQALRPAVRHRDSVRLSPARTLRSAGSHRDAAQRRPQSHCVLNTSPGPIAVCVVPRALSLRGHSRARVHLPKGSGRLIAIPELAMRGTTPPAPRIHSSRRTSTHVWHSHTQVRAVRLIAPPYLHTAREQSHVTECHARVACLAPRARHNT